ncbi:hypothetical protein BN1708_003407, partial [Verticillium longisporum]
MEYLYTRTWSSASPASHHDVQAFANDVVHQRCSRRRLRSRVVRHVRLERVRRQVIHPRLALHEADEPGEHLVVARTLERLPAADDEELRLGARERHVDSAPVLEQVANSARVVGPHQRQHDDLLVAALEAVGCVHLHAGVAAQPVLQQRQLGAVVRHDANLRLGNADGNERLDELRHDARLAGVDDAVALGLLVRPGLQRVRVDEADARLGLQEVTDPAPTRRGTGAERPRRTRLQEVSRVEMPLPESAHVGHVKLGEAQLFRATPEPALVDEAVAQSHDVLAHAILMLQVDDRVRVRVREQLEQADVQATLASLLILHQRRKLVVVSYQDKSLGHPDGAEADWQRDLRRLIDDAIIKCTLVEDMVADAKTRGRDNRRIMPRRLDLIKGMHRHGCQRGKLLDLRVHFGRCPQTQDGDAVVLELEKDIVHSR